VNQSNKGPEKITHEGLNNLYSSYYNVRRIKSRRMGQAWHIANMGKLEICIKVWSENQRKGRRYLGELTQI
jgi:hypothetical protein